MMPTELEINMSIKNKLISIIAIIVFNCSIMPWPVLAKGASKKIIRIAVLPYAESVSPEINKNVHTIEKQLKRQKNISILPYRASKQITQYYLDYVDARSRDTELSKLIRPLCQDSCRLTCLTKETTNGKIYNRIQGISS